MQPIFDFIQSGFAFIAGSWMILIPILTVAFGLFTVDEQQAALVTRFGKFARVAHAGLNVKIPFIESVAGHVSLRVEQLDVRVTTKTKDNVFVTMIVAVQHVAMREKAFEAFYRLDDVGGQMEAYIADTVRAQVPTLSLDDLFERKDEIADAVQAALSETMAQYGWTITKALVTDISPDEKVVAAMNDINAAQRERVATQARAEAEKILKVTSAEADADAMALQGKGIADQRKAILEGLATSVKELEGSISGLTVQEIMQMIMLTRYFDTLQEMAREGTLTTIMLPGSPGGLVDLREQIISAMAAGKTVPGAQS